MAGLSPRWGESEQDGWGTANKLMNMKKKLLNPFVLVAQGFIAGAALFWSTQPAESGAVQTSSPAQTTAVQQIAGL